MNLQMADQSESRISDSIGVVTSFIFIELFHMPYVCSCLDGTLFEGKLHLE